MAAPKLTDNFTQLLDRYGAGDRQALDRIVPILYQELRRLAGAALRKERSGHTLQPTALVSEAYLRLVETDSIAWRSRGHFMGAAANVMRRVLIDHARARGAQKRGGGGLKVTLDESKFEAKEELSNATDLLALEEALKKLEAEDPRRAKVVELRYFGGLSLEEIAALTESSLTTVKRDWTYAKAWLHRELAEKKNEK